MRQLTEDPLFYQLRREAESWHLTQSGAVIRHTTKVEAGRDVDVEAVVYTGPLGLKREKSRDYDLITIEFPASAPTLHTNDVVHVDTYKHREYPLFVVKEYAPASENRALAKAVCWMRQQPPKTGA